MRLRCRPHNHGPWVLLQPCNAGLVQRIRASLTILSSARPCRLLKGHAWTVQEAVATRGEGLLQALEYMRLHTEPI
jgi:hypothetical protein